MAGMTYSPTLQRALGFIFTAAPLTGVAFMSLEINLWLAAIVGAGITCGVNLMIMGAIREHTELRKRDDQD